MPKLLVGALATCLITIGIAAQTGTIRLATPARHPVPMSEAHSSQVAQPPAPQIVRPAPQVPSAPAPAAAPVQPNGGGGEGDGGDGGGD
ncbi:MAG TPA: hypothetical protein VFR33_03190 [Candidatus Dormibacteraeota bacterium]|nr:hypothetical protein [Candidatus Dormibacteraeota bacterium]